MESRNQQSKSTGVGFNKVSLRGSLQKAPLNCILRSVDGCHWRRDGWGDLQGGV